MKYKLTKTEFAALSPEVQKEYTLDGETALLKIEGEDAPTAEALERANKKLEIEKEHRKTAEIKLKEADDRAVKLQKDLETAGGNKEEIAKLQKAHADEIEKLRGEREAEAAKAKADRDKALISEEATKFATERFTVPTLIADQVAKRMTVEEVNGVPVVRVVNADGSPSTASIADLHKEFLDNGEFKSIIKAKAGGGSGATPSGSGSGASRKTLAEMTATEQAAFEREDPGAYAAAVQAEDA